LLAVGLVVAGYGLFLAQKRGALPPASVAPPPPAFAAPGTVTRLGTYRDSHAFAVPAAGRRDRNTDSHRITLRPKGTPAPDAGVATFSSATGAGFHWSPLSEMEPNSDGALVLDLQLPQIPLSLTLAAHRDFARHRYLARAELPAGAERPATTELEIDFTPTRFTLPEDVQRAGPLQLIRLGDPNWQPPLSALTGLFIEPGEREILLGPGNYELADPIDTSRKQRFAVPSEAAIALSLRLARPRAALR